MDYLDAMIHGCDPQPPPTEGGAASGSPRVRRLHVIPIGDHDVHAAQEICWCHPVLQQAHEWPHKAQSPLWVHNAKDCRESQERAGNENASEGWIIIAEYVTEN